MRKIGFSWKIFFLGIIFCIPPLTPIGLILLFFSFFYNKLRLKKLIKKGYLPSNKYSADILSKKGFIFNKPDEIAMIKDLEKEGQSILLSNFSMQLPCINKSSFFVKEIVKFSSVHEYDILDPENNKIIMECRETDGKIVRTLAHFRPATFILPFNLIIKTPDGRQIVRISKGISFFLNKVFVFDEYDKCIGLFTKFSGKGLTIFAGGKVFEIKGKWSSNFYKFIEGDIEYAHISLEQRILSRNEDLITIHDNVLSDSEIRKIILAAAICLEITLKLYKS